MDQLALQRRVSAAREHADDLARRNRLDRKGFGERMATGWRPASR